MNDQEKETEDQTKHSSPIADDHDQNYGEKEPNYGCDYE
jgi:hypothetical protein